MQLVQKNESVAAKRRMRFDVRTNDGISAANGVGGGQPQISINDGPWTATGIGVLNLIGNGFYYADVAADQLDSGVTIAGRFRDVGNTVAETRAQDSLMVVEFDPWDVAASIDVRLSDSHGGDDWTNTPTLSGTISNPVDIAIDDAISVYCATTFARAFVINGDDFTDWTQVVLTIKADKESDDDTNAVLTVKKSTTGTTDGIVFQNGQAITGGGSAHGALTVAATDSQITVNANIDAVGMNIKPSPADQPYAWELTIYHAGGRTNVGQGEFNAVRPVRRAPTSIA